MSIEMTIEDECRMALARQFYLHLSTIRKKFPSPAPFAPEWAYDYADIAINYLGADDEALDVLRIDYK